MEVEQSPSEEDPVLVNVGCDGYAAMRLEHRIEAISGDVQSVAIHLNFVGEEWDLLPGMHPKSLSLSGLIIAECDCPPGETEIEMGCSIPTRFANFYLSRFAIPELPTNPTRREMNRILGSPIAQAHNAGTVHPDLGFVIPDWAIHNHNGIGLRCSYADELLTNISVVNPDNWLGDNSHVC